MTKRTSKAAKKAGPVKDQAWFERKVAELKAEADKLSVDRQEALLNALTVAEEFEGHRGPQLEGSMERAEQIKAFLLRNSGKAYCGCCIARNLRPDGPNQKPQANVAYITRSAKTLAATKEFSVVDERCSECGDSDCQVFRAN